MQSNTRLIRPKYLGEQYHEILAPGVEDNNSIVITMADECWTVNFKRKLDQPMMIAYYCEKVVDIVFGYLLTEEQRLEMSNHFKNVAIDLFRSLTIIYQQACQADGLAMGKVYIDWFTFGAPFYKNPNDNNLYMTNMPLRQISLKPVDEVKEAANDA